MDSNPAKPTPSAHAQSATPSSKSTQKRKSGGGDANTSNGATSKKIKIEPVCSFFILHTTHATFKLQSYNHIAPGSLLLNFPFLVYRKPEHWLSRMKNCPLWNQYQNHLFRKEENPHPLQKRKSGKYFVQNPYHAKIWC